MVGVIADRIAQPEAADGFILDGFPRTIAQAEALDAKMAELGRELTAVILIEVSEEEIVRRLSGRRTCPNGHVFHVEFDPPSKDGVCDVCGEPLQTREDDKPEVVRHRLGQYEEKTKPLIDDYEQRGLLERVDGEQQPDEVGDLIRALLATLRMEEEA